MIRGDLTEDAAHFSVFARRHDQPMQRRWRTAAGVNDGELCMLTFSLLNVRFL